MIECHKPTEKEREESEASAERAVKRWYAYLGSLKPVSRDGLKVVGGCDHGREVFVMRHGKCPICLQNDHAAYVVALHPSHRTEYQILNCAITRRQAVLRAKNPDVTRSDSLGRWALICRIA